MGGRSTEVLSVSRQDLEQKRAAIAHDSDHLHTQTLTLTELERRIAHGEASTHGRGDDSELSHARSLAATLRARRDEARAAVRTSGRDYGIALGRWEHAQTEARVRAALPPDLRHFEDSARLASAQRDIQRRIERQQVGPIASPSGTRQGASLG